MGVQDTVCKSEAEGRDPAKKVMERSGIAFLAGRRYHHPL